MKTFLKWVAALLCVWMVVLVARAEGIDPKLEKLLEGKDTEYVGSCRLDKNGMLIFGDDKMASAPKCVVGFDPKDKKHRYVLLFDKGGASRLIKFNIETRAQKDIWVSARNQV